MTTPPPVTGPLDRPNLLLVILDDVGIERLAPWARPHESWPDTPFIDDLTTRSLVFDNAYAMPTCTPTRYNLLTGRIGRRAGLGKPLAGEPWEVDEAEDSLAERLAERDYTSAVAGKWHLATPQSTNGLHHPAAMGFVHHQGSIGNIPFFNWWRIIDGVGANATTYPTTDTTDAALDQMATLPEPWFVWTAYNAAHVPLHVPPAGLNPGGITNSATNTEKLHAMIVSFDIEFERLMDSVDLTTTTVVFLGDNGTHRSHIPDSWEPIGGKGSVFESGVRVPMFMVGAGVTAGHTEALIHAVDVFPTLLDLAGVPSLPPTTVGTWNSTAPPTPADNVIDGISFADLLLDDTAPTDREYVYTERFLPLGDGPYTTDIQAVRDERYKLIRSNGTTTFHDLLGRHDDGPDLLLEPLAPLPQAAHDRLLSVMDRHNERL